MIAIKKLALFGLLALILALASAAIGALRPLVITSLITSEPLTIFGIFWLGPVKPIILLFIIEIIDLFLTTSASILLAILSTRCGRLIRSTVSRSAITAMADRSVKIDQYSSLIKTHTEVIETFLRISAIPTVSAIVQIVISLIFIAFFSIWMLLLFSIQIAVLFVITIVFSEKYKKLAEKRFSADAALLSSSSLNERRAKHIWLSGMSLFWFLFRLKEIRAVSKSREALTVAEAIYHSVITSCLGFSVIIAYFLLIDKSMAYFAAFVLYSGLIIAPVLRVASFLPEAKEFMISLNLIKNFINNKKYNINRLLGRESILIEYKNFKIASVYPSSGVLKVGEHVLIQGDSGVGKTLFLEGLAGVRPDLFEEVKLLNFQLNKVQLNNSKLGVFYLPETPIFESGSVLMNCGSSKFETYSTIKKYKLFDFESDLHADEFFRRSIGQNGEPLSLGERQRIQILRVILQGPSVLLLDEALSGISEEHEYEIIQRLIDDKKISLIAYVGHRNKIRSLFSRNISITTN